jgi:hypothetical protein
VKLVTLIVLAACMLVAGCVSYSRTVVEKPVPANTVVYADSVPAPATTTTVYTPR